MSLNVFTNFASSLLASGITDTATSVTIQSGDGALFPAFSAGQQGVAVIEDTSGNTEVVFITARTGDSMTIDRGEELTTALAFASGSRFELRGTAGVFSGMLQKNGGDTLSGTTVNNGVIQQNTSGSIQGGEIAGAFIRGAPGETDNQIHVPTGGAAPTIGTSAILTAANFLNNLPSGVGAVVTGMVLLWSGASNAVPAGYALCDGGGGRPDLRDLFVLGAGGSLPGTGGSASTTTGSSSAGTATDSHVLTTAEMPAHNHMLWQASAFFTGNAGPAAATRTDSGFAGGAYVNQNGQSGANPLVQNTGSGTGHTHGLSSTAHNHTYSLPPYKAMFYIIKT